jgi:hypothetical protein
LCQIVLYLVGNCINWCHFGEGFLLVNPDIRLQFPEALCCEVSEA